MVDIMPGDDTELFVWSLTTGLQTQSIPCKFHGAIGSIMWVSGGQVAFAFRCADGTIHIYSHAVDQVRRF